jgi:surface polysaccharide O-acyltransferase-like enzyme
MAITRAMKSFGKRLDSLAEKTPPDRDRYVDFLRAFSIIVVILWHWVFSVVHRADDGRFSMPNPIAEIPLGWLATWLLQVMPVFFFVGGFANFVGWQSVRRDGGGAREFLRTRLVRLLAPALLFVAAWIVVDIAALALGRRSVLEYGMINFIPLWFLAAYVWVVLLVPITAPLHKKARDLALVVIGAAVVLVDLGRFNFGLEWLGWANSALVWIFVHQVGYFYGDGTLVERPARTKAALAIFGLTSLIVITNLPVYPRSMVAVPGQEVSHMYPTTVGIAMLAIFQVGVVMLLQPYVSRWLDRRGPWKAVIAVNSVIMTLFLWHMTAFLMAAGTYEALGFELLGEPTAAWWLQRPLWLLFPGAFLAVLVALFARAEAAARR